MKVILVVILFVFPISCSLHEEGIQEYVNKFYKEEDQFNELIRQLKADTMLYDKFGTTFHFMQFKKPLRGRLEKLGIEEIHVFSWGRRMQQFDLKTDWRTAFPIHLCYNTLDSIETVKGFYRKDENSNEVYGLGNSWVIWVERKLIDAKRQADVH